MPWLFRMPENRKSIAGKLAPAGTRWGCEGAPVDDTAIAWPLVHGAMGRGGLFGVNRRL
jgi:hypothetical protein